MTRAILALGANIGDPLTQLKKACASLDAHPDIHVIRRSKVIETAPWGKTDQPKFYNMAVEIHTALTAHDLLDACLMVEKAMGRERDEKWGPRLIDIDIVTYGHKQTRSDRLTLPHEHAHERAFVLDPVREIAPDMADWIVEVAGAQSEAST
ncbi:2-amino-4-hydroxy-6-hydroxymethyldihydropteridine diphosphokinase [Cucumibacter marinus]|uniref:2-amino-4-hydroxy-6- hydroxymethyldihydropteridine diphosphokinase n=1 Tax=Cucumibacter marinus TaxID=1121252 RepID=UPI000426D12C|nr:2-amino-4-hydroxy-6-hydroxymethyldihydropteridine diphosphokinase [Cucumibacter marinus]